MSKPKLAVIVEGDLAAAGPGDKDNIDGLGTAATRDVGTDPGQVLVVGVGGWLGHGSSDTMAEGYPIQNDQNISQIYCRSHEDNDVPALSSTFHFAGGEDTWGRLRVDPQSKGAWIQGGVSSAATGWTEKIVLSGDILQEMGDSETQTMSQKAISSAIASVEVTLPNSVDYHYDSTGKVAQITSNNSENTIIDYNNDGTVGSISYPDGRVETYTYDASGNVVSMTATGASYEL